jgi:hypothetical protein
MDFTYEQIIKMLSVNNPVDFNTKQQQSRKNEVNL